MAGGTPEIGPVDVEFPGVDRTLRHRETAELLSDHLSIHVLQFQDLRGFAPTHEPENQKKLRRWAHFFLVDSRAELAKLAQENQTVSAFDLRSSEKRAKARLAARPDVGNAQYGVASQHGVAKSRTPMPHFAVKDLPREVRESLYNLEAESNLKLKVPGDQLAFYCFNYGAPRALSFAAGLPRLCLESAAKRPGFRPKGRALLAAVLSYREGK